MWRLMIFNFIRGIDTFLRHLNVLLNVCFLVIAVGCISTKAYHTAYRQLWEVIFGLTLWISVGYLLCNILESILMRCVNSEAIVLMYPHDVTEKRYRYFEIECKISWLVAIAIDIAGRIMVGWYIQTFTGDPWWASIKTSSFVLTMIWLLGKIIRMNAICKRFVGR